MWLAACITPDNLPLMTSVSLRLLLVYFHTIAKVKAGQCVIFAGPGVRLSCSKTKDGFPCITIQPNSNNSEPSSEKDSTFVAVDQTDLWNYNEVSKEKSIVTFHKHGAIQPTDTSSDHDKDLAIIANDAAIELEKIRQRIKDQWPARAQYLNSNHDNWKKDPRVFFGLGEGLSGLEYSLKCILESADGQDQDRCVMYKALLAREVDERVKAGKSSNRMYRESSCRQVLFEELYENLHRQRDKIRDRRVFDYSILLGRAVNMLDKVNGAFSLALVSILTQKQYVHDSSALGRHGKRTLTSLLSESCLSERTLIVLCGGLTRRLSPRSAASSQQLSPFVRTYGRLTSPVGTASYIAYCRISLLPPPVLSR